MIMDDFLEFADGADFANEVGTANVGDIIDLGLANRDPGHNGMMKLVITVETAADGGAATAGTTQFKLVSDGTSTISTTTSTVHLLTKAHVFGDLTAGTKLIFPLPISGLEYERYLGLQIVQAVEGEDDLVCSAALVWDAPAWRSTPDAAN